MRAERGSGEVAAEAEGIPSHCMERHSWKLPAGHFKSVAVWVSTQELNNVKMAAMRRRLLSGPRSHAEHLSY